MNTQKSPIVSIDNGSTDIDDKHAVDDKDYDFWVVMASIIAMVVLYVFLL